MNDKDFLNRLIYVLLGILIGLMAGFSICKADPYIAIGSGVFKPNIDATYIAGVQSVDDATKSVSHLAIGYDWNDWAIELGHESFGTFGYRAFKPSEGQINARIDSRTFYIAAVRYFGSAYGLLGVHKWYTDAEIQRSIAGQQDLHITGTDGMLGVGYDASVSDHFGIRLSYTKFLGIGNQDLIGSKTDAGVVGLSLIIQ